MMRTRSWGGRRAQQLTQAVLTTKGFTCHLCGLPGATSADHDPPRSVLLRAGVPNPDQLQYLHPSHLLCNLHRKARPITDELRAECRARFLASRTVAPVRRSARFA
jgi:hypothetical protein